MENKNVCASLVQLAERAFADSAMIASDVAISARASELRRCFDEALSQVLRSRNAAVFPVPEDIWLLVMDHLPLDDLLSASRACRTWRSVALANSRLWTRVTLRVQERGRAYITNIAKLQIVLPRSGAHLLELDVHIAITTRTYDFASLVMDFLALVAPRLVRLPLVSAVPWLAGPVLSDICALPQLRELTVPPPRTGCSSRDEDCWIAHLQGEDLPNLVDLALHSGLRATFSGTWPALRSLRCVSEGLSEIRDVILSAGGLQRFAFEWRHDPNESDDVDDPPLSAALVTALRAIPDLDVTAPLAPTFVESAFEILGRSSAPRLRLAFRISDDYDYDGPLQLRPFSRLAVAERLTASYSADSSEILLTLEDGSGRVTQISARDAPQGVLHASTVAIDWELVPSLGSLDVLTVDACLWPDLLRNFPKCPRLSEVVLNVRTSAELQALLAATAHTAFPSAEMLHIAYSDGDGTIAEQVRALQTVFNATRVTLIGQSPDGDSLRTRCELSP